MRRLAAAVLVALAACSPSSPAIQTTATTAAGDTPVGSDATVATTGGSDGAACWSAPVAGAAESVGLVDVADDLGLGDLLVGVRGHAVAAGDVDGDGWVDLVVGGFADRPAETYRERGADGAAPDRILLGGPDGFVAGPSLGWGRTSGAVVADLDGDGDADVVLARNHRDGNRNDEVDLDGTLVFRNDGDAWEPVTLPVGPMSARAAVPIDVDGDSDGDLDLVVVEDRYGAGSTRVLRNEGDLSFVDATDDVGLPDDVAGFGAVAADFDGDGATDLFVAGSNRLFAGGDGRLREVDAGGFAWPQEGNEDDVTGVTAADVDADGDLDLVLGPHFNSVLEGAPAQPIRLFRNDGGFAFTEVTEAAGLTGLPTKSPHVDAVDVDQDGIVDLVTTASTADGGPVWFRGVGVDGGVPRFERVGEPGPAQYWVTGTSADLDRDGRVEIVVLEWEPALPARVWSPDGAVGHWVSVTAPLGSTVEVFADGSLVGSGVAGGAQGYAAGAPGEVRVGVGTVERVDVAVDGAVAWEDAAVDASYAVGGC